MKNYYRLKPRREKLAKAAASWIDTPWRNNTCKRGPAPAGAVSCDRLAAALAVATGHLPQAELDRLPQTPLRRILTNGWGLLLEWIDTELADYFTPIDPLKWEPLAGDIIVLLNTTTGDAVPMHLGTYIADGEFIHVMRHCATALRSVSDPTYGGRIVGVRRPIEKEPPAAP